MNMATVGNRKQVRFTLDVTFVSEDAKEAFLTRLNAVRDFLMPEGADKLDHYRLLSALFALKKGAISSHCTVLSQEPSIEWPSCIVSERLVESAGTVPQTITTESFLSSRGKYYTNIK